MKNLPTLTVSNHPLIQHKLNHTRDKSTFKNVLKSTEQKTSSLCAL